MNLLFGLALLTTLVGLLLLLRQIVTGLSGTGLRDDCCWGLYIKGFFFLSAVAAGVLVNLAVAFLLSPQGPSNPVVVLTAAALALGALTGAGLLLGADAGKPLKVFKIITGGNWASPMTWDFYLFFLLLALDGLFLTGAVDDSQKRLVWGGLTLFTALAFILVHGLLFTISGQTPVAAGPFLMLELLIQSVLAGSAVLCILNLWHVAAVEQAAVLLLTVCLGVLGVEVGRTLYSLSLGMRVSIFAVAVPAFFALLLFAGITRPGLLGWTAAIVSIMALLAVLREKIRMVDDYLHKPLPFTSTVYFPSTGEYLITLGGFGLCFLVFFCVLTLKGIG